MSGRLTVDNLSEGLKKYLEGLGLTEEQVSVIIQEKIGDLSTLLTSDKSNIVNSVNEIKTKLDGGQNYKLTNDNGNVVRAANGSDIKTLVNTGHYYVSAPADSPAGGTAGSWYIEVRSMSSDYIYQTAVRNVTGDNVLEKYERTYFNGTWTAWRSL